jgi:ABC-type sugar transport system substrate-binding protein
MKFAALAAGALFLATQVMAYEAPKELIIGTVHSLSSVPF